MGLERTPLLHADAYHRYVNDCLVVAEVFSINGSSVTPNPLILTGVYDSHSRAGAFCVMSEKAYKTSRLASVQEATPRSSYALCPNCHAKDGTYDNGDIMLCGSCGRYLVPHTGNQW